MKSRCRKDAAFLVAALFRWLPESCRQLCAIIRASGPNYGQAPTTFGLNNKSSADMQNALWAAKIRVRAQGKNQRVRLCAHLYVNPEDIARTLNIVHTLAKA